MINQKKQVLKMDKRILEKMQSYIYDENIKFDKWVYEDYKRFIKLSPGNKKKVVGVLDKYCKKANTEFNLNKVESHELAEKFYFNIVNNTKKELKTIYKELIFEESKKKELLKSYEIEFNNVKLIENLDERESSLINIYLKVKLLKKIKFKKVSFKENRDRLLNNITGEFEKIFEKNLKNFNNKYKINLNFEENFNLKNLIKYGSTKNYIKNSTAIAPYIDNIIKESLPEHPKDLYKKARSIKRRFVIHFGETNSGKTYEALNDLKSSSNGVYLAPLRLLALEIFETLNDEGINCDLLTGEEELLTKNATHVSSTIEKLNVNQYYNLAVIDEAQLMSDRSRGWAWTRAVLGVYAREIHVCCSKNALDVLIKLIKECEDDYFVVEHTRKTPLILERDRFKFPEDVIDGDALIVFSRKKALAVASILDSRGIKSSVIYGFLPPDTRRKQVQSFLNIETSVVVSTDAIGMGINLPIKRIVFLELLKFDGFESRILNTDEILQIAGRAGRMGIYNEGFVNTLENKKIVKNAMKKKNLKLINEIYVFPDEELFNNIEFGSVYKIMTQWKNFEYKSSVFKKSDLSHNLELLKYIYINENESNKSTIYRLCCVPFDETIHELMQLWKVYAKNILDEDMKLEFPSISKRESLEELELYYKKLDLYFNMSKVFRKDFEFDKLKYEKKITSEKIHDILLKDITSNSRYCSLCGKILPWNFKYDICDYCYYIEL
jgi:superfamily II DNA/RNA helicase